MHARANRKSCSPHARNRTAPRVLEFVHDAHGSFRADLVGIEETAGDAINRQSQGDVTMMGVQIHAHSSQSSERALAAIRRLRRDPNSSDHRMRPQVNTFWSDVAYPRANSGENQPGILSWLATVGGHHFRVSPDPIPVVIDGGDIPSVHIRDRAGNFV